ncbi:hypothetical protein C8Q73DRAFT_786750 [Cubamyces lactineus]|nr:hypothetical protein C8Q73DRAFT_786750 [Cubamyces lactineus]
MILNNTAQHELDVYSVYGSDNSQGQSFPTGAIFGIVGGILGLSLLGVGICKFFQYYADERSNSPPIYYRQSRAHTTTTHGTTATRFNAPTPPPPAYTP